MDALRQAARPLIRFVVLAKMDNAGTRSVVDSFSEVLNRHSAELCESMTSDQAREMHATRS